MRYSAFFKVSVSDNESLDMSVNTQDRVDKDACPKQHAEFPFFKGASYDSWAN